MLNFAKSAISNVGSKLFKVGVVLSVVGMSVLPFASEAKAYERHEHVFESIGANSFDQASGDRTCKYKASSYAQPTITWIRTSNGRSLPLPTPSNYRAWDGTYISGYNHAWYHRSNGHCVFNK